MDILGHRVDVSEVRVKYVAENTATSNYEANSDWQALILLDCTVDQDAESEGLAREVTNRMQKLRKEVSTAQDYYYYESLCHSDSLNEIPPTV